MSFFPSFVSHYHAAFFFTGFGEKSVKFSKINVNMLFHTRCESRVWSTHFLELSHCMSRQRIAWTAVNFIFYCAAHTQLKQQCIVHGQNVLDWNKNNYTTCYLVIWSNHKQTHLAGWIWLEDYIDCSFISCTKNIFTSVKGQLALTSFALPTLPVWNRRKPCWHTDSD